MRRAASGRTGSRAPKRFPLNSRTNNSPHQEKMKMKALTLAVLCLALSVCAIAQTPAPAPSAFQDTTVSFNLTPISLRGAKSTIGGAETDILLPVSTNNVFGETTIVDSGYEF